MMNTWQYIGAGGLPKPEGSANETRVVTVMLWVMVKLMSGACWIIAYVSLSDLCMFLSM
jgi:hypothetical protein